MVAPFWGGGFACGFPRLGLVVILPIKRAPGSNFFFLAVTRHLLTTQFVGHNHRNSLGRASPSSSGARPGCAGTARRVQTALSRPGFAASDRSRARSTTRSTSRTSPEYSASSAGIAPFESRAAAIARRTSPKPSTPQTGRRSRGWSLRTAPAAAHPRAALPAAVQLLSEARAARPRAAAARG